MPLGRSQGVPNLEFSDFQKIPEAPAGLGLASAPGLSNFSVPLPGFQEHAMSPFEVDIVAIAGSDLFLLFCLCHVQQDATTYSMAHCCEDRFPLNLMEFLVFQT
mmetsp:Transcript_9263/g.20477  ORF Transcript_9263/g.20477 Transcript_9263/m.20477 type:complete len:104 (-) Transcript_9263:323-634(-)